MNHRHPPPFIAAPSRETNSALDGATNLKEALGEARSVAKQLVESLVTATSQVGAMEKRVSMLEHRVRELEDDSSELASRLVAAEHQSSRLMNLYVATYQLHSTLDPAEVRATIAEVAISLLGAERFALLLKVDSREFCDIALAEGLDQEVSGLFEGGRYLGGDPMLDATLTDGALRIGPTPESSLVATVPLVVQESTVGALAILKLFEHRGGLDPQDRDLLDLLGAHAASALFAAQAHSTVDRKMRTLESLVQLARRG